jgi:lipoprotein-anchoring transpeptidase ErfK/SrfK
MLHRLLPLILIIAAIVYIVLNFSQIRREVVYKLGISGDPTTSCCNEEEILTSNGSFDESANLAIFNGDIVDYPKTSLAYNYETAEETEVLGTTTSDGKEKWIEVDLEKQWLSAWEGNQVVMQFPISSGKWAQTPKGTFEIWYKTKRQSMIGGSKELGTYYNLPNVPNNMFFYKGFALHGAYWHNNFGHPMSHGCVNEPLANAAQIFEWAGPVVPAGQNYVRASAENPGTRVYVH